MSRGGPLSERAIVLAPNGRDGQIAVRILKEAGHPAETRQDVPSLCAAVAEGAGLAIIADEAINAANLRPLADCLAQQPSWSDLPIILLTRRGGGPERNPDAARLAELLGNVLFVERPFHPTTLAVIARMAVRGRCRQYEARSRLEELAAERSALSELTGTLEQRVQERTAELVAEIAAREQAQEQLLQAQKMESLGQLTGGVAHDFNNLLTAVMSNLELLRKRARDDERALRLIDGALQGARRGASLTQRMLAFARQQELKTGSADLANLISGMRDLLQRSLGPRIALSLEIAEKLPPAQVDADQVELAILNLAINARDAMPDGGTIVIRVGEERLEGRLRQPPGPYLRVQVVDTGSGMDAAVLKKAAEPFFSTKPTGKGTGLGLSMVDGLALQLGGLLELSSEVGRGTTASLWLPIATNPIPVDVPMPAAEPAAKYGPARILVVDDDALIAMSTVDMLEDLGHEVVQAASAERALEMLEAGQEVDLIVTDQAMPGMSGTEFAKVLRRSRPDLPVLLATGCADLTPEQRGDLPRLSKPYQQAQLEAEIARLLEPQVAAGARA